MSRGTCFLKCINTQTNVVNEYYYADGLVKNPYGKIDNSNDSKLRLEDVLKFEDELKTYIYNIDNYIAQTVETINNPNTKKEDVHMNRECLIWLADGMQEKLPEFIKRQQEQIYEYDYQGFMIGGLILKIKTIIKMLYDKFGQEMEDADIVPKSADQLK